MQGSIYAKLVQLHCRVVTVRSYFRIFVLFLGCIFWHLNAVCSTFSDEYEIIIHSEDAFAPVGYVKVKALHLADKEMVCLDVNLVETLGNSSLLFV